MSKLTREDFYILNPFYRGMNNEEPLYEQDVTSRLQAIKQVKSVDGCIAALKTPGLQHTVEIAIVRKMKSLLKADGAEAHKRNTALTVELNEFCQQQGIGKIGESIVPALKTYIKNIQGSLDLTERLIVSEIGDFTAGLGNLGEPQTPEQIHEQLMARVRRVFADVKLQAFDGIKRQDESVAIKIKAVEEFDKFLYDTFPNEGVNYATYAYCIEEFPKMLLEQAKAGAK